MHLLLQLHHGIFLHRSRDVERLILAKAPICNSTVASIVASCLISDMKISLATQDQCPCKPSCSFLWRLEIHQVK